MCRNLAAYSRDNGIHKPTPGIHGPGAYPGRPIEPGHLRICVVEF